MKRNAAMLLLMSMLLSVCASCGGTTEPETDTVAETAAETESVETELTDSLPEKDFGGAGYRVLTAAEQWQKFYNSEQNGEVINDAVYARNLTVEERFNVKLDYQVYNGYTAGMADVKNALSGSVMSGGGDFDLVVGQISYLTPLIADKLLMDLYSADYLDLDKPWWFMHTLAEAEIANHLYLGAGSLGNLSYAHAIVTFFNKNVAEEYSLEDIYALVQNGTWTWDKMVSLSEAVLTDLNGDQKYGEEDVIGVLSTWDYLCNLGDSMGYVYTTHNDDGTVVFNPLGEKLVNINEMMYSLMSSDHFMELPGTSEDLYGNMVQKFAEDKGLFMIHRMEHVEREAMREMDGYGIIPTPKYDEQQETYVTYAPSDGCGIPAVVTDPEMSAILLEALQYESYKTVRPAYYEIALKGKYAQDEISGQMLDIIFENAICTFGYMYSRFTGGYPAQQLGKSENYTSWFEKNHTAWQNKLDDLIQSIQEG